MLEAAEDWAQVFVPKYGIEKRVYFNDDPRLQAVDFDDATGTAAVNWAEEEQTGVERLVPLQRAYECYWLDPYAPRPIMVLRLLLAARMLIAAAVGAALLVPTTRDSSASAGVPTTDGRRSSSERRSSCGPSNSSRGGAAGATR